MAGASNVGLFVPTTNIFAVAQKLRNVDVNSDEFKQLIVSLYEDVNRISITLNLKDSGYYIQQEFVNGQVFFPNPALSSTTAATPVNRQVFRSVVNFGALPNTATKSVAHNIDVTTTYSFTRIYACSSNTARTSFLPIPYASPTDADNIELNADDTNVNITTGSDRTDYITTYVILEYIKQ